MIRLLTPVVALTALLVLTGSAWAQNSPYPWKAVDRPEHALIRRIPVPLGYRRTALPPGSFGYWLRRLPLKEGRPPVILYDGTPKKDQ